jgi:MoxR-like ATPase
MTASPAILAKEELVAARQLLSTGVRAEKGVQKYILDIVRSTRGHESLQFGAGPRASLALLESGRALAALRGRGRAQAAWHTNRSRRSIPSW